MSLKTCFPGLIKGSSELIVNIWHLNQHEFSKCVHIIHVDPTGKQKLIVSIPPNQSFGVNLFKDKSNENSSHEESFEHLI